MKEGRNTSEYERVKKASARGDVLIASGLIATGAAIHLDKGLIVIVAGLILAAVGAVLHATSTSSYVKNRSTLKATKAPTIVSGKEI